MTAEHDTVRGWWRTLDPPAAAALRRCGSPAEALLVPECLSLIMRMNAWSWKRRCADLARVLAHVKHDDKGRVMRTVGRQRFDDETAVLSEPRFRRIIRADHNELPADLIRLIRIMGGECNVAELYGVIRYWGPRQKEAWAADYYAAFNPEKESAS